MKEAQTQNKLTSQDFVMSQLDSTDMQNQFLDLPHLAKLDHLLITNFKSFKQQTFTGPFLGFTSIIGPNGSGKSNVLDALMFCLCGQNLKHNFFDLREYINREKAQSYKDMSKKKKVCSVTASFVLENGNLIQLKRQLDPDNNQAFFINGKDIGKKVYENFLFKQGINPHIPNYAITQGQIDKLLLKEPQELAKYIENLSGSFLYKRDYDLTKEEISEIRKTLVSLGQKIMKLKNDKKNAKNISDATKQCEAVEKQYEQIVNKLFLGKVFMKEMDLLEMEQTIVKKKNQERQKIEQINKRKLKIQEELRLKQELNRQINQMERKILELNAVLKTLNRPDLAIKTKEIQSQQKELQYIQNQFKKLMDKKLNFEQSIPQTHSSQIVEEYLGLYSQWQSKNRELNFELQNKKTLYFNLQSQIQFQKSLLQSQQQKQKNYKQQDQKRKRDIDLFKEQISQINNVIEKLQKQIKQKEQMFKKNDSLLRDLKQEYEKVQNEVQNLEEFLTQNVETAKDKDVVRKLALVDGFKGLIEQKMGPKQQKYTVAFSILTSSISKYILCKDQNSSKQISQKLKNMNTIKTLIILSNVKKPNSNESIKQNVGKAGISALDIIDYQTDLQGFNYFLQQFCRGKIVCENLNTALEIRNKKIPGLRQIITFDGEVIRNDGTITACGNADHIKRTFKIGSNKKSLDVQLQRAIKARQQLKIKITNLQKQCKPEQQIRRNQDIIKLQKKKQDIQAKIQFLISIKPKQIKSFKTIERDISLLLDRLQKVEKQIQSIQKNMSKDQLMSEFMKKHNIQNLQSFRSTSNLQVLEKQIKRKNQILRQTDQINGMIESIKTKIDNKIQRINTLKSNLNYVTNTQNKKNTEKQIQESEKKIKQLRDKASKLGVYRDNDIQLRSEVIEMETKYKFLKQKVRENTQDLKIQLGATMNIPRAKDDWKMLENYISQGPLEELTRKKIQNAIRDLQAEKKISEDKLQKLNSMNLMSKKDQKDVNEFSAQIKQLNDALIQNNTRKTQLQKKLQQVKVERRNAFMAFFEKLKQVLKQTYQVLTQIQPGVGGKADLYLQNSQLPFDHGIYFTPTPPNKRFIYDLDQLSGGQKSIASLALQYSLAICSKSPFLILDESDAYLDSSNTVKLLKLLQDSTKGKKIQIILVTHKATVFTNCESLVGVCRPKQQFSKIFSCKVK